MNPPSKRVAARSTGVSPRPQRNRRSLLPPSLRTPLPLLSSHQGALQQPPRREHNAIRPDFTLEELEEMENDPEATNEDDEEDTEDWLNYMQSQQTSYTQSQQAQLRPYESPYLTQDPTYPQSNISTL